MRHLLTALLLGCASFADAACLLPPDLRDRMNMPQANALYAKNSDGIMFYDYGCLDEAAAAFRAAIAIVERETKPTLKQNEVRGIAEDGLALTEARRLLLAGKTKEAIPRMVAIVRNGENVVTLRAALQVAPLLDDDSPQWAEVEEDLETLAGFGFWQARKAIAQRHAARGEAAKGARYLEEHLASATTMQDHFAMATALADVWRRSQRLLDAWLLIRRVEHLAGENLIDAELRIEVIRVAAEIAQARAAAGDRHAAAAAATYAAALKEVRP